MNRCPTFLGFVVFLGLLVGSTTAQQPSDKNTDNTNRIAEAPSEVNQRNGRNSVPVSAPVRAACIPILDGLPSFPSMKRPVFELYFATSDHNIYPFPTPVLGEVTLNVDGEKVVLFNRQGFVGLPDGAREAKLTCLLFDPLASSQYQDAYLKALQNRDDNRKYRLAHPQIDDNFEVDLAVQDPSTGMVKVLGTYPLQRQLAKSRHTVIYDLRGEAIQMLRQATRDAISLIVRGKYEAEFSDVDLRITSTSTRREFVKHVHNLLSNPRGGQSHLLIDIGGSLDHNKSLRSQISSAVLTSISVRAGINPNPELMAILLDSHFVSVAKQCDLQREDSASLVSFLLADGIKATAPLAKYTEFLDAYKNDKEQLTTEVMESLSKNEISRGGGVSIFGIGGEFHYGRATEEAKKDMRDRFDKSLQQVERAIKGEIAGLSALNLRALQQLESEQHDSHKIEVKTFNYGTKELRMPISFQALATPEDVAAQKAQDELKRLNDHIEVVAELIEKKRVKEGELKRTIAELAHSIEKAKVLGNNLNDDKKSGEALQEKLKGILLQEGHHNGCKAYIVHLRSRLRYPSDWLEDDFAISNRELAKIYERKFQGIAAIDLVKTTYDKTKAQFEAEHARSSRQLETIELLLSQIQEIDGQLESIVKHRKK